MFKSVLAATDRVTQRDPAVQTAALLAAANSGRLYILHILESASTRNRRWVKHYATGKDFECDRDYEDEVRQRLKTTHQEAAASAPRSQIRVTTGYPWEKILHWARQVQADLIVMGPHSGRAFQKGVVRMTGQIGSTLQGVIAREKCPAMIVNQRLPAPVSGFERILVGIDFSSACECALCFAGRLAEFYDAQVFALHMIPIPPYPKYTRSDYEADRKAAGERLHYFCRPYLEGTDWTYHIRGGALPHLELLTWASKVKADLIVLGSHTRQTEGKWYPGSAVERVSHRSNCPVMVVNAPEALQPWQDMQASLARLKDPKDRHIRLFGGRTRPGGLHP